jgi:hypothetical protein
MPTTADAIRMRGKWRLMPDRRPMTFSRRLTVGPPPTYAADITLTECWHRNFNTVSHPGNPGVYVIETCRIFVPRSPNSSIDAADYRPMPGDLVGDTIGVVTSTADDSLGWVANIFPTTIWSWVNQLFIFGTPSVIPIPITDTVWNVESCTDVGALGTWELGCVSPRIVNAGSISIKFQNPTEAISTAGQRVVTGWSDISTVSVWVQLVNTQTDDILGCRTMARNATVYTSAYPTITAQSTVLEVVSGRRYTIKEYRPARNLNELNEYELELIP